jgi:hypothetical protein
MMANSPIQPQARPQLSAVHGAIRRGPKALRAFIDRFGANAATADNLGLLEMIVDMPGLSTVRKLRALSIVLDAGADANGVPSPIRTPLISAVSRNSQPMIKLLFDRGADPNLVPQHGKPGPLHSAMNSSAAIAIPLIRQLFAAGADPNMASTRGHPLETIFREGRHLFGMDTATHDLFMEFARAGMDWRPEWDSVIEASIIEDWQALPAQVASERARVSLVELQEQTPSTQKPSSRRFRM